MKKIFFLIIGFFYSIKNTIANQNAGIFEGSGVTGEKLKNGDISLEDMPNMIRSVINFGMGLAGTIAIIFIIFGAYQILLGSIENDKTKGKNTIIMAIGGFIIASLAWFIIRLIIDNFGGEIV